MVHYVLCLLSSEAIIISSSFQPFRVQIVWHKFLKKYETNYMPYSYANTKMVQDEVFKHKIHRQVFCSSGDPRAKQRTYLFQLLHRKEGCGMH